MAQRVEQLQPVGYSTHLLRRSGRWKEGRAGCSRTVVSSVVATSMWLLPKSIWRFPHLSLDFVIRVVRSSCQILVFQHLASMLELYFQIAMLCFLQLEISWRLRKAFSSSHKFSFVWWATRREDWGWIVDGPCSFQPPSWSILLSDERHITTNTDSQ